MSDQANVTQLLRDAITAAREGDKARARMLFEEVVEQDEENEKAWFWLASLAEDDDERILFLNNVLTINPANERAQSILSKIEAEQDKAAKSVLDEEVMPGVSRRIVLFGGAGLAILIVIICGLIALIISNNQQQAANEQATLAAINATDQARQDAAATIAAEATQTAMLAQFTPTPLGATLPPTWTPIPSPTSAMAVTATPLPPAVGSGLVSGTLLIAQGDDLLGEGFVPLYELSLDGEPPHQFYSDRAGNPSQSPQGDMRVYTRFSAGTREQGLELMWTAGTRPPQLLSILLGGRVLQKQDWGSFSPDGGWLAFSAREPGNANSDIYIIQLSDLLAAADTTEGEGNSAADALIRLTDGSADNTAPVWGDSTRLIFVEDATSRGGGVDLKIVNNAGQVTALTTDGNTLIEDTPALAPDGQRVAFSAHAADNPDNADIYIMSMSGGVPLLIVDSPGNDVHPRWSPDGRFLVYGSNRSGAGYEIYVVEVDTYANYQVTVNGSYDMANQWLP